MEAFRKITLSTWWCAGFIGLNAYNAGAALMLGSLFIFLMSLFGVAVMFFLLLHIRERKDAATRAKLAEANLIAVVLAKELLNRGETNAYSEV